MDRFTLLYRFSTDNGSTWIDLTPQVDSRQTVITQNLCTNNFTSAKDEATFVMPETPLFDAGGNATPKKLLMDALMGDDDILIEINAPGPVDVLWKGEDVLWKGLHVQWRGSVRRFTGYADRSSMNLRSYPLPPRLTVKVQDVSILRLDDKVDSMVCWESYTIKQIVRGLLSLAGYDNTDPSLSDADTSVMSSTDNVTLEAFVIDKDNAKTYRQYIDTLLFEAGGYVIDFTEDGTARLVHLQWDGNVTPSRTIDNPMNSGGVAMKGTWLKEDGARVKWSTLEWGEGERIWQAGINQTAEDGVMIGEKVQNMAYWPSNGDQAPVYMEYDARLLDKPYLARTNRWQNEDLSIIMAKNISVRRDAMQGSSPFDSWVLRDPTTWPTGDTWEDKYGLTSNPQFWPTKMWMLLQNQSGSDVNLTFFSVYGDVLYRSKVNTIETDGAKNPKEYTSEYIYDENQAQRFLNFYWHFMKTSRYQFSWSEPNRSSNLNDVVSVGVKGNGTYQKALIAGRTSKWINDNVEIISYNAVGVTAYVPSSVIATGTLPSSAAAQTQPVKNAIAATFSTVPSFTLAEWQVFGTAGQAQSWTITNPSDFTAGDVAIITGKISDMDDTAIHLYMNVTDVTGSVISGTGIRIEYLPVLSNWDFDIGQSTVPRNDRIPWNPNDSDSYTDIHLTSKQTGIGVLEYWTCDGTSSPLLTYFVGANAQTTTGSAPVLRIYRQETYPEITVTMRSSDNAYSVTKKITVVNETEYDHDFGAWSAPTLPKYINQGNTLAVIDGDFFVASTDFTGDDGQSYVMGVPYIYDSSKANPWHNAISVSDDNTDRLLRCLGTVLNDPTIQPSTSSIYAWFQNLVAQNAVINNLFSQAITILSNGYIKGGDRYNTSGTIADWTKEGFWFGANGKLMAALQSDGNGNTYVGTSVGANSNSPGSYNTAMGYAAMFKTTSGGDYNIALGYTALHENQTGDNNVAIGYQALYHNTASENIGIGTNALVYNTSGTYGVAIGTNALYSNTTGNYNVGIGYETSKSNTTGSYNLALGYHALYSNTAGSYNIALGYQALYSCTSSGNNIAIGGEALKSHNGIGGGNIALGRHSMQNTTSGYANIAIGVYSLSTNTSGVANIAIGQQAGNTTTGQNNIAIGYNTNNYSQTGYRQVNINDSLICLEFKSGRTYAQVYAALKTYLPNSSDKVTCIGIVEGDYASIIEVVNNSTIRVRGEQYHNFTTSSSSTLTKRMVIFFVNPQLGSDTSGDCLA